MKETLQKKVNRIFAQSSYTELWANKSEELFSSEQKALETMQEGELPKKFVKQENTKVDEQS
ncbi:hypothetical protein [Algoriella sp.]|uniref:hypothetical protein n=1 Tax=Algoriella sp. TaxID=1872434 RepID=UPI002FC5F5F5